MRAGSEEDRDVLALGDWRRARVGRGSRPRDPLLKVPTRSPTRSNARANTAAARSMRSRCSRRARPSRADRSRRVRGRARLLITRGRYYGTGIRIGLPFWPIACTGSLSGCGTASPKSRRQSADGHQPRLVQSREQRRREEGRELWTDDALVMMPDEPERRGKGEITRVRPAEPQNAGLLNLMGANRRRHLEIGRILAISTDTR